MNDSKIKPEKEADTKNKDRIKSFLILGGFIILILIGIYFIFNIKSPDPSYEIILKDTSKGSLTLQIYTKDTSESGIIEVNDKLLKQYDDKTITKYFFYFDDKAHTGKFFQLFVKQSLTPDEQLEMSHNNAMYYYEKSMSNSPCLTKRLSQGWKIIKCY